MQRLFLSGLGVVRIGAGTLLQRRPLLHDREYLLESFSHG
jgi:hypothetical protein